MNVSDIGERTIKTPVRALMVGRDDNVALLLSDVKVGDTILINGEYVEVAVENIPAGYKVAVKKLAVGQDVITYNQPIGQALRAILPGERVHTHNLGSGSQAT